MLRILASSAVFAQLKVAVAARGDDRSFATNVSILTARSTVLTSARNNYF